MGRPSIIDRLTVHRWSGAEVDALLGKIRSTFVAHAVDPSIREQAASGGAVSALLISLLENGSIDGALVCVTEVEDGCVRARYRIARTAKEVLAARGSTYVLGNFAGEALPMVRRFDGRLAVVALPCEVALVSRDASLGKKVALTITLFCGHTTENAFLDAFTKKLSGLAGGSTLVRFRFRSGHWRGRLTAEFANGSVIDEPSSYYLHYHNLYFGTPKKCMICGDHFGYHADISIGDLWSQKFKNDSKKHSAIIAKTRRGAVAISAAADSGILDVSDVTINEVLDGQRRTAPFHFNTTARSLAGEALGLKLPDRVHANVRWHDLAAARLALKNHLVSQDAKGIARVMRTNRWLLRLKLYWFKGLESLPTGPLTPCPAKGTPRFSIIAATVYGNRGAEAMLEASIGRIRDRIPNAHFSVFSYYPKQDTHLIRDSHISVRNATPAYLVLVLLPMSLLAAPFAHLFNRVPSFFPRPVRELAESVALVDLAGVAFIDGREKFLPFNILTILPAMLLGTPVFKLAQALGPFKNPINRFASLILKFCTLVVPRGHITLTHIEQIVFPVEKTLTAPDVAFLFESRDSLSSEGVEESAALAVHAHEFTAAGRAVVGLCPSTVLLGKAECEGWDYVGFMASVASGLIANGHAVLLFPYATRAKSSKCRNNDLLVVSQIAERLGDRNGCNVLTVRGDMNAAALRAVLKACSVVAVSRFHAMVAALSIGVPVCVIGWSHKYLEVMMQFELGEFVFDYSAHDPNHLCAVIESLLAEREAYGTKIMERLPSVQSASHTQFEELFRRLNL